MSDPAHKGRFVDLTPRPPIPAGQRVADQMLTLTSEVPHQHLSSLESSDRERR